MNIEVIGPAWDLLKGVWDKVRPGARLDSDEFVKAFNDALNASFAEFRTFDAVARPVPELEQGIAILMQAINAIVFSAQRQDDSLTINSCFMLPVLQADFTPDLLRRVRFFVRDPKDLLAVLALKGWADPIPGLVTDLALPVEGRETGYGNHLLFGAPRAFWHRRIEVIGNTLKPTERPRWWSGDPSRSPKRGRMYIPGEIPFGIRNEIEAYFFENRELLRSFVSIPIEVPAEDRALHAAGYRDFPLAVLNVQSNRPRICGAFSLLAPALARRINPMLSILSRYISKAVLEGMPRC